jgi:hypothetical protein
MIPAVILLLLVGAEKPPERCSVGPLRNNPEGYFWPLERIRDFVTSAEVIVRVRADRTSDASEPRSRYDIPTEVHFTVLEVLRGVPPSELKVVGVLVERDDYNRGAVPYRTVRPSGQRGSCIAQEYRKGSEYLLLLRTAPHVLPLIAEGEEPRLNPYWAPLAPLNEQVRGADDPWVRWVKTNLH